MANKGWDPFILFLQLYDGIGRYHVSIELHDLVQDRVASAGIHEVDFPERLDKMDMAIPIDYIDLPRAGRYEWGVGSVLTVCGWRPSGHQPEASARHMRQFPRSRFGLVWASNTLLRHHRGVLVHGKLLATPYFLVECDDAKTKDG
jgi:hypothetical protein